MAALHACDLKTILHSKRANVYYLEHCRVWVNGGRVEYVTAEGRRSAYWNIPIANTTTVLLATGTSITQAAMPWRHLIGSALAAAAVARQRPPTTACGSPASRVRATRADAMHEWYCVDRRR